MNPAPANRPLAYALLAAGIFAAGEIVPAIRNAYLTDPGSLGFLCFLIIGPVLIAGVMLLVRYRAEVRRDPGTIIAAVLGACILTGIFVVLPYDILYGELPLSVKHWLPFIRFGGMAAFYLMWRNVWNWIKWLRDHMRPALIPLFPLPVPPYVAPPSAHGTRPVDPPIAKPTPDGH